MIARKTTKEILADSFLELAREKPIDKITVRDIVQNCGYSQATFYRQFKDKYDLIAWTQTQHVKNIMDRINSGSYPWKQTLIDGAEFYHKHKDYFANLLEHTSGHDSFIRYMTEINSEALRDYIMKKNPSVKLSEVEPYIKLYVYGTVCLTCEWIVGGCQEKPQQIAEVYENSLPFPLHQYLL